MRSRIFAVIAILLGATFCAAQNTVKIGIITSLTGSQAAFGEAHKNGYSIAVDQINAKGGVLGKKIELDFYDDQSKPDQAVQGVSKLVDQDHQRARRLEQDRSDMADSRGYGQSGSRKGGGRK